MDVIYVTDYPWIIDRSEELLKKYLYEHTGDAVLYYIRGYKNGRYVIVVYESKEERNEDIFEWYEYYSAL